MRFVYVLDEGSTAALPAKDPANRAVRILAAFSLPVRANPLNLRRERFGLQRLVRDLNQTQGLAVELRVLQYGATRDTLREALEDGDGWDIIQLSGHGQEGRCCWKTTAAAATRSALPRWAGCSTSVDPE